MKKTPKKSRTSKPTAVVPPMAVVLARVSEPNICGLPREFLEAYAEMPRVAEQIRVGSDSIAARDVLFKIIDNISGLGAAERKVIAKQKLAKDDDLLQAVAVLYGERGDLIDYLAQPVMDAGFYTGLAFACYMLLDGGAR